ncbi:MAG: HAMP domain-containing histidine kinase [Beijerinckiaceae bacterium]|nr:HAMP domain-containing histidine kinase [Beijerinckiaceae bacterium]
MTWVAWDMRRVMNEQVEATIEAEIKGLSDLYRQGGVRRLVDIIDRRSRQPGASLYLVTNFQGQAVAGNILDLPPEALRAPGLRETEYERVGEPGLQRRALVRIFVLPGGFRLLVGRDLEDRETIARIFGWALVTSLFWITLIGMLGGLFVARRVLRRVDAMNESAQTIMEGNLATRLPVGRSNDELDRLATNLNSMLERIQELMAGLREVSDNIAHDLKTPLTRLRNHAEQALRTAGSPEEYRSALEEMIEESDGLIGIFNALLMIARLEAGAEPAALTPFDAGEAANDVAELYEPLAEEAGFTLSIDADPSCVVSGNRELIGQALSNLVDNALKYGAPRDGAGARSVRIEVRRQKNAVELSVSDRGPGIPQGDRERVLGRFVRLENSRSQPGSGLGLSLAGAVARLHNGELRIEDNAPGLRVTIVIPATGESPNKPG